MDEARAKATLFWNRWEKLCEILPLFKGWDEAEKSTFMQVVIEYFSENPSVEAETIFTEIKQEEQSDKFEEIMQRYKMAKDKKAKGKKAKGGRRKRRRKSKKRKDPRTRVATKERSQRENIRKVMPRSSRKSVRSIKPRIRRHTKRRSTRRESVNRR